MPSNDIVDGAVLALTIVPVNETPIDKDILEEARTATINNGNVKISFTVFFKN